MTGTQSTEAGPVFTTTLTIYRGAGIYAKAPCHRRNYRTLMALLSGLRVTASIYTPERIVGFTHEAQLRDAYQYLDRETYHWVTPEDVEDVVAEYGQGAGFDMAGVWCEETAAEIGSRIHYAKSFK